MKDTIKFDSCSWARELQLDFRTFIQIFQELWKYGIYFFCPMWYLALAFDNLIYPIFSYKERISILSYMKIAFVAISENRKYQFPNMLLAKMVNEKFHLMDKWCNMMRNFFFPNLYIEFMENCHNLNETIWWNLFRQIENLGLCRTI